MDKIKAGKEDMTTNDIFKIVDLDGNGLIS